MGKDSKQWTLYALQLEKGKWYVDITSTDAEAQLKKHKSGTASQWTKRYAPVKVSYSKELGDISEDDAMDYAGRFLRKYMEHYGDGNVRGGDVPDVEQKPKKQEKKSFRIWNPVTQSIVIAILVLIIGYLLLDKYYLMPSTALTITQ